MLRDPRPHKANNFRTFELISSRQKEAIVSVYDLGFDSVIMYSLAVYEDNDNKGEYKVIGSIPDSYFPINPETGYRYNPSVRLIAIDYLLNNGYLAFYDFKFIARVLTRSHHIGHILMSISKEMLTILRESNFFTNEVTRINI